MVRVALMLASLLTGLSCQPPKLAASRSLSDPGTQWIAEPVGSHYEPQYGEGVVAWNRYVAKHLVVPEGVDIRYSTARLRFIVDRWGKVSDITLQYGDPAMKRVLIQLIKDSGEWIPAMQGGRSVNAYKEVQITYCLSKDES